MELIPREEALKMIRGWFEIVDLNPDILVDLINSIPTIEEWGEEWIPLHFDGATTNIPHEKDGAWVIVTDGKCVSVERIRKDADDYFCPRGRWFEIEDAIAWMPLPLPPKGE